MKQYLLLMLVILIPAASADLLFSGQFYSGSTFTFNNYTYTIAGTRPYTTYNNATNSIEGTYSYAVLTSTGDSTVMIRNNTCVSTLRYNYCYVSSTIDYNNITTFHGGNNYLEPKIGITINSIDASQSSISIARDTAYSVDCGSNITMIVNITNSGGITTSYTYSEQMPINTVIMSQTGGTLNGNSITFSDIIVPNATRYYSYTIIDADCMQKSWNASYSYSSPAGQMSGIVPITLNVNAPYYINESLSQNISNNLSEPIRYDLNITSLDPNAMIFGLSMNLPDGIDVLSTNLALQGSAYVLQQSVDVNDSTDAYMILKANSYGEYNITRSYSVGYGAWKNTSTDILGLEMLPAIVDISMHMQNSSLIIYATNKDLSNAYDVYGTLTPLNMPVYFQNLTPATSEVILNKSINGTIPSAISFKGFYRDIYGNEQKLEAVMQTSIMESNAGNDSNKTVSTNSTLTLKNNNGSGQVSQVSLNISSSNSSQQASSAGASGADMHKDMITTLLESISKMLSQLFG